MDQMTGLVYGLDAGKWIKNHPEYLLQSGFEGLRSTAGRRDEQGQAVGSPVAGLTLDETVLVDMDGA